MSFVMCKTWGRFYKSYQNISRISWNFSILHQQEVALRGSLTHTPLYKETDRGLKYIY